MKYFYSTHVGKQCILFHCFITILTNYKGSICSWPKKFQWNTWNSSLQIWKPEKERPLGRRTSPHTLWHFGPWHWFISLLMLWQFLLTILESDMVCKDVCGFVTQNPNYNEPIIDPRHPSAVSPVSLLTTNSVLVWKKNCYSSLKKGPKSRRRSRQAEQQKASFNNGSWSPK